MDLQEVKELSEKEKFYFTTSEEEELRYGENEFHKYLREIGFYRVYATYYKDPSTQCFYFYCTGFINSEDGYNWLISTADESDNEEDYSKMKYDLYVVTIGNHKYDRKDKKVFTGTAKEVLEYSKKKDKEGYKIAVRRNEVDYKIQAMNEEISKLTVK